MAKNSILSSIKELKFRRENNDWQASGKVQHPSVAILAGELVHAFKACGGTNYVEFTVTDPSSGEYYTLSLRRREGKEPSELVLIMKSALEQIAATNHNAGQIARNALKECGYDTTDNRPSGDN